MKPATSKAVEHQIKSIFSAFSMAVLFVGALIVPEMVMAAPADFGGADTKVCGFFDNIKGLLNIASIAVVTIAIIFAGYQIAFAHKRIADVAPILIGGLLIGAAGQLARMLMGDDGGSCGGGTTMLMNSLPIFRA
jgi:type IV secretion system protein VirB2